MQSLTIIASCNTTKIRIGFISLISNDFLCLTANSCKKHSQIILPVFFFQLKSTNQCVMAGPT